MEKLTKDPSKHTDKKPKDLLRAIGKIEHSDWNIKQIENKIEQSKKVSNIGKSKEKVPKWNREQFVARQNRLTQPAVEEEKYKTIDNVIKTVDKKLKEGKILEGAKDKVSSITSQLKEKEKSAHQQPLIAKSVQPKPFTFKNELPLDKCFFCKQRVYLMEKVYAEQLIFHRTCLKCHYCNQLLKMGSYAFDKDDPKGRFYCIPHYRMKPLPKHQIQKDTIDTRLTPERIEFENVETFSDGGPSEGQIDEAEWTDKNFLSSSEHSDDTSSESDFSDEDGEDTSEDEEDEDMDNKANFVDNNWFDYKLQQVDSEDDYREYSSEG